jgi:hypothetical protein
MKRLLRDFTVALMAGVAGSALWALIAGKAHSIDHLPYAAGSRYAQSSTGIIIENSFSFDGIGRFEIVPTLQSGCGCLRAGCAL